MKLEAYLSQMFKTPGKLDSAAGCALLTSGLKPGYDKVIGATFAYMERGSLVIDEIYEEGHDVAEVETYSGVSPQYYDCLKVKSGEFRERISRILENRFLVAHNARRFTRPFLIQAAGPQPLQVFFDTLELYALMTVGNVYDMGNSSFKHWDHNVEMSRLTYKKNLLECWRHITREQPARSARHPTSLARMALELWEGLLDMEIPWRVEASSSSTADGMPAH